MVQIVWKDPDHDVGWPAIWMAGFLANRLAGQLVISPDGDLID